MRLHEVRVWPPDAAMTREQRLLELAGGALRDLNVEVEAARLRDAGRDRRGIF